MTDTPFEVGDQRHRDCVTLPRPASDDALTASQILFLWDEHVKRGDIRVWIDEAGVFHFAAEGHPGVSLKGAA